MHRWCRRETDTEERSTDRSMCVSSSSAMSLSPRPILHRRDSGKQSKRNIETKYMCKRNIESEQNYLETKVILYMYIHGVTMESNVHCT